MIEIRKLEDGDEEGLADLMEQFYGQSDQALDEEAAGRLFERARDPAVNLLYLVAADGDRLVGMISLTFGESSFKVAPFAWADDFFVSEESRGEGVGRDLLSRAAAIARSRGCSNILVGVGEGEGSIAGFYEPNGFLDMRCKLFTLPLVS